MESEPLQSNIRIVRERLAKAELVTVLTGSGISADSGIPTFRGNEGLWKNFRAEALATPEAFSKDPRLVWEWYDWRRGIIASCEPNAGHYILAEMEKAFTRFHLITQNVDGLHEKAGSTSPIELHGNIWKVRCTACSKVSFNFDLPLKYPPECKLCGGLLRPHIVWFGESLDPEDLEKSAAALRVCEVMLVIGTSSLVYPAASFAGEAQRNGAFVAEINLEETPISNFMDVTLLGKGKDILPALIDV